MEKDINKLNDNSISTDKINNCSQVEELDYSRPVIDRDSKNAPSNHVFEEALVSSYDEALEYNEPRKNSNDILEENVNNTLKEEIIKYSEPKKPAKPTDILEEPLSRFGLIEENLSHRRTLIENFEKYQKPQRPNLVQEETLFEDKKETDYTPFIENFEQAAPSIVDNTLIDKYLEKSVKKDAIPVKKYVEKLMEADSSLQQKYCEIKDYIIKYKKVKTRISAKFETVKIGRNVLARFNVVGKAMRLYLNLDYIDVTTAYPNITVKNVTDKKAFEDSPVLFRVKSDLSLKRACILLDMVIAKFELVENPKFEKADNLAEPKAMYKAIKSSKKRSKKV